MYSPSPQVYSTAFPNTVIRCEQTCRLDRDYAQTMPRPPSEGACQPDYASIRFLLKLSSSAAPPIGFKRYICSGPLRNPAHSRIRSEPDHSGITNPRLSSTSQYATHYNMTTLTNALQHHNDPQEWILSTYSRTL